MDALDINEKRGIRSIPTYFGAEEEEEDDIPDMEEFDEADNVVENDPVSFFSFFVTISCDFQLTNLYSSLSLGNLSCGSRT